METEKKSELIDRMSAAFKGIASNLYDAAFHDGRHSCRERYVKSGLLVVDQEKIDEAIVNPCKWCKHATHYTKTGCMCGVQDCDKKQRQLVALEINKYFGKKE